MLAIILILLVAELAFPQQSYILAGKDTIKIQEDTTFQTLAPYSFYEIALIIHTTGSGFEFSKLSLSKNQKFYKGLNWGLWSWKDDKEVEYYNFLTGKIEIPGKKYSIIGLFTLSYCQLMKLFSDNLVPSFTPFAGFKFGVWWGWFYKYQGKVIKEGFSKGLIFCEFKLGCFLWHKAGGSGELAAGYRYMPSTAIEMHEGRQTRNFGNFFITIGFTFAEKKGK